MLLPTGRHGAPPGAKKRCGPQVDTCTWFPKEFILNKTRAKGLHTFAYHCFNISCLRFEMSRGPCGKDVVGACDFGGTSYGSESILQ